MTATCWEETLLFRAVSQLHLVCPVFPLSFLFYEVIHQVLHASRNQCKCVYMCRSLSLIPSIMKGRCLITSYFYTNQEVFWNLLPNLHTSEVLLPLFLTVISVLSVSHVKVFANGTELCLYFCTQPRCPVLGCQFWARESWTLWWFLSWKEGRLLL